MAMADNSWFVPVHVPLELLPTVYRLLADHADSLTDAGAAPIGVEHNVPDSVRDGETDGRAPGAPRAKPGRVWSDSEYRRLLEEKTVSAERVRRIMNAMLVKGAPKGRVSTSQLADETGLKDTQIRAALSWLTRFMRANPGTFHTDDWPFGWAVGRGVDPNNPTEFHYVMSDEQAHGWLTHLGPDAAPETLVDDTDDTDEADAQP